jgi:hypothetical protein
MSIPQGSMFSTCSVCGSTMTVDDHGNAVCPVCDANARSEDAPAAVGSDAGFAPCRTHWGFLLGFHDYQLGQAECPFLAGSRAAAQWRAGWADAEEDARRGDVLADERFELTYCNQE